LAYETGRQLEEGGADVELVALVDAYPLKDAAPGADLDRDDADLRDLLLRFGMREDVLRGIEDINDIDVAMLDDDCDDRLRAMVHLMKLARGYRLRGSRLPVWHFAVEPEERAIAAWRGHVGSLRVQ